MQGKVTPGAFHQRDATGECLPAATQEAIKQVETVRTDGDQPLPKGADSSMISLENKIRKAAAATGDKVDFSKSGTGGGAPMQAALPVLSEDFNIHSQPITIDRISEALNEGPVMGVIR